MGQSIDIQLIRSRRKSIGIQVKPDGRIIVRAPLMMPRSEIDRFVSDSSGWIEKQLARLRKAQAAIPINKLSDDELDALRKKAKQVIPARVEHYARLLGVSYGRITIRCQHTKWGSCSSAGNLNFNCLLMLAPDEVIDSVVVHELCHRLEMNHSQRFYAHVTRVFPQYQQCRRWLRDNGAALLAQIPEQ